jgi:hypothetical protein
MKYGLRSLVFIWCLAGVVAHSAAVPQLINFQGRLDDATEQTVPDGTYSVTFRLLDHPLGGNLLWEETQDVTTTDGLFAVLLGAVEAIPDTAFDVDSCYLEVQPVGSDPIAPRARLTSVAYSRQAGTADLLGGVTPQELEESSEIGDSIAAHRFISNAHHQKTVSASELGVGTLAEERLPQRGIDSTEIQDASISARQVLDEPGIAHKYTSLTPLSSTIKIIDSVMVIPPSFGYILVLASGWFYDLHSNGGQVSATLSISASRTAHDGEHTARFEVRTDAPSGHTTENFMIQRVKTVTRGEQVKLFLLGSMVGNEFPNIQNVQLNTLYFPTSYGEIDAPTAE